MSSMVRPLASSRHGRIGTCAESWESPIVLPLRSAIVLMPESLRTTVAAGGSRSSTATILSGAPPATPGDIVSASAKPNCARPAPTTLTALLEPVPGAMLTLSFSSSKYPSSLATYTGAYRPSGVNPRKTVTSAGSAGALVSPPLVAPPLVVGAPDVCPPEVWAPLVASVVAALLVDPPVPPSSPQAAPISPMTIRNRLSRRILRIALPSPTRTAGHSSRPHLGVLRPQVHRHNRAYR